MIDQHVPHSVAEQARLDMTLAAGAAERANRPKTLLYGAILLLVIAVIYTLTGVTARQAALGRVAKERRSSNEIIALVNDVKRLQTGLAERGLDPNPHIGAGLELIASLSGAQTTGPVTDTRIPETDLAGITSRGYKAQFENQDPGALLQFLNATIDAKETAGVGIYNLDLRPGTSDPTTGAARWSLTVDFVRRERKLKR